MALAMTVSYSARQELSSSLLLTSFFYRMSNENINGITGITCILSFLLAFVLLFVQLPIPRHP